MEIKHKHRKYCEGCAEIITFSNLPVCRSGFKPSITVDGKEIRCPCGICLVKCMCQKSCSDIRNYYELLCLTFKEEGKEEIFKQSEEI